MDDKLLEPTESYHKYYREDFKRNAENYFDDLVKKSNVDADANRETTIKYRTEVQESRLLDTNINKLSGLKTFCIIVTIVSFLVALVGLISLIKQNLSALAGVLMLVLGSALGVVMILVIKKKLKNKLKRAQNEKALHDEVAAKYLHEAWEQMAPLNASFESEITKELIEKTVPLIKLDDNFDMHRFDYLNGKYGFTENVDENRSTIGILSGEILGNPFVIDRDLLQTMGTCTYTGSILITWTTTVRDSNGNTHTQVHTQNLTASLTKPKPYYSEQTCLIYGNEAAPDLTFTHMPTHAEKKSEIELKKFIEKGSKHAEKLAEAAVKSGESFTTMSNPTFDALFGATDRNHKVQFRLLFTPLAQNNMIDLMTDKQGYGDDFIFKKRKCLNIISSEHSASFQMDTSYTRYQSFDIDMAKDNFMQFNENYFKSLFFDLAPLLSIPLYQQYKPSEYIYRDNYPRNYTDYEAEYMANKMGSMLFAPARAKTPAILKTSLISKDGAYDNVQVTAHAFDTVEHIEYIAKMGGDGHIHKVPVKWTEYIPVIESKEMTLTNMPLTDKEFHEKSAENSSFAHGFCFNRKLFACITENEGIANISKKLDSILGKVK